ncbi:MAG: S8 family serine peptidase [Nitrospirota bacterium]
MKKIVSIFLALFLVSCGSYQSASDSTTTGKSGSVSETGRQKVTAQSILANMESGKYKEGELLVKFKTGVQTHASSVTHQSVGASIEKKFTLMPELDLVKLPDGLTVGDAVVTYMSDPNVEYAEPNYLRRIYSVTPNDTYFVNQWGLNNTGHYAYGSDDADIDAPEAWDIITGSQSVGIAIIDTGIDYNHSDLVGNIWNNNDETNCTDGIDDEPNGLVDDCRGWNFVSNNNDPMDDYGHGTHVAGTVGAHGNNGQGVTGVMWRVRLIPLKAFDANGSGSDSDIVDAINYAVEKGANVINASWGGPGYSSAMYDAINAANSAGILFVAAAGNGDGDGVGDNNDFTAAFPASYDLPNIIAVAATDQRDERVPFSNYGPMSVDVAAPGVYIWSTVPNWWSTYAGYGRLETMEGTSMAAPHVTGLAGLLFGYYDGIQNTKFAHSQVRSTILRYVDWLPSLNGWIAYGRINAHKAVSSLLIPAGLTATAEGDENTTEITSTTYSPSINLAWTDNSTGEDGFDIERKSSGVFTKVATVGPNVTTYNDPNLDPLTTYTYRVRAFNNIAVSMPSTEAAETTLPGSGKVIDSDGGGGCSVTAGKDAGRVDLLVMLLPVAAILTLIKRRKR